MLTQSNITAYLYEPKFIASEAAAQAGTMTTGSRRGPAVTANVCAPVAHRCQQTLSHGAAVAFMADSCWWTELPLPARGVRECVAAQESQPTLLLLDVHLNFPRDPRDELEGRARKLI